MQANPNPSQERTPAGLLSFFSQAHVPTEYGNVQVTVFVDERVVGRGAPSHEHMALVFGDVREGEDVLVRIHSECWTGEALHSLKCDCREQLDAALTTIAKARRGVVLYLRQEGRGIGLGNKIRAYALQNQGLDTFAANRALGFADDLRDFSIAGEMLAYLGVRSVSLLTNNPLKISGLEASGIRVVSRRPMPATTNPHNASYLETKNAQMGHDIRSWLDAQVGGPSRITFTAEQVGERVAGLAREIARDFAGKELVAVGVLSGGFMFFGDLLRQLQLAQAELGVAPITLHCGFMGLQSYGDGERSTGVLRTTADLAFPVSGKHVLLIEDIVDTGMTLSYLRENLALRQPVDIKVCALLHRSRHASIQRPLDYVGFTLDTDDFVFGYGMDYKQRFRELPFIATRG
ncbi:GTP cyclohydrolase II [Melittangium boletus]|uniref:GTP cyclohydrolase-2 n=1 Tax=Melittangium boletus DSM 14713 TaxID=1294270 RepID=A0A250IMA2_9BACT|nr:GTP cyclohydrolase II [Melittangium boletus]ATB32307.1 GTP cyclohydrolase II [Melittangium boletus DSM 14713]